MCLQEQRIHKTQGLLFSQTLGEVSGEEDFFIVQLSNDASSVLCIP